MSKITCLICGGKYASRSMVTHRNECIDGKFGFCMNCVKNQIENDTDPVDTFRMLNIPYVQKLWTDIYSREDNPLSAYLKAIAPRKQYKTFADSSYVSSDEDMSVNEEMIGRWGSGLSETEYIDLETTLNGLKTIKMPETALEERMYVDQTLLIQRQRKAIADGNSKDIKDLQQAMLNGYKSLGLDVVQTDKKEIEALGQRIKNWEMEEPLPVISKEFEDVDKIKEYFTKFFLIQMKRMFGKATEDEIAYQKREDFEWDGD